MKKKLGEKLSKIDRKFKWFWVNHIDPRITYAHFMNMLDGNTPMRDDIKEKIESYLGLKQSV